VADKKQYAKWCYKLIDGDDPIDEIYEALLKDGFVDEDQEWVCEEDD
jgi:hypothetical protein